MKRTQMTLSNGVKKLLCAALLACVGSIASAKSSYQARFDLALNPAKQNAAGSLRITPGNNKGMATQLDLRMPKSRYSGIAGDGMVQIKGDRVMWQPPAAGGVLRYTVLINNERSNGAFDAQINNKWAIFRGDKVFPKAKVKARGSSVSQMVVTGPRGWHINSGFARVNETEFRFDLSDPKRRFDSPKGWMIAGEIANRAEVIAGTKVVIAGPEGLGMRRQDMLAFLNFTLPELKRAFGTMPKQILIVSGPDPMWRGGLSAPNSLYLHMDRPMISENGTSTLLHELTHSITRLRGADGADWIAEGLAEFYGLEALNRAGGMTQVRYNDTIDGLKRWSKAVKKLTVARSSGEVTARAVLLIHEVDREIRSATKDKRSLDDVTRLLIADGNKISNKEFQSAVQKVLGRPSKVLSNNPLLQ